MTMALRIQTGKNVGKKLVINPKSATGSVISNEKNREKLVSSDFNWLKIFDLKLVLFSNDL